MRVMLALALSAAGAATAAAPVPRAVPAAPTLIPAAGMVGVWDYQYGDQFDGALYLFADGSYFAYHDPELRAHYVGRWSWDGRTLTLDERRWCMASGEVSAHATRYEFVLSQTPCGTVFQGHTTAGTRVVLLDRR